MFNIEEIVKATDGVLLKNGNGAVSGISTDSRKIRSGEIFYALKGPNYNGTDFISDADSRKAAGAVVEKEPDSKLSDNFYLVRVKDTLGALGDLARFYKNKFNIRTVAVTGSNGKTTVKELIFAMLSKKYRVLKNEGNLNNEIGLPLTIFRLTGKEDILVTELGINHFGEMTRLSRIFEPDAGLITNIGDTHLEFLKNRKGVARAKAELIPFIKKAFFLDRDSEFYKFLINSARKNKDLDIVLYSLDEITGQKNGTFNYKNTNMRTTLHGRYNLKNILCAIKVAEYYKIGLSDIRASLESFSPVLNRGQIFESPSGYFVINDSYNANPESVKEALISLKERSFSGRSVAVLGDMMELGRKSSVYHQKIGEFASSLKIDLLFLFGNLVKNMKDGFKNKDNAMLFEDKNELILKLKSILKKGDWVLIKGSRAMRMEDIAESVRKGV